MYQFYSVSGEDSKAGVPNQMGTVSIFLEAYSGAKDYNVLNKLICQWRRVEEETREACGLPSITSTYSGCPKYSRGQASIFDDTSNRNRNLRTATKAQSIHDVLAEKLEEAREDPSMYEPLTMTKKDDFEEPEQEWDEIIQEYYQQGEQDHGRHLGYENVTWHNYFGLLDVKTEYYFRYSGYVWCYSE